MHSRRKNKPRRALLLTKYYMQRGVVLPVSVLVYIIASVMAGVIACMLISLFICVPLSLIFSERFPLIGSLFNLTIFLMFSFAFRYSSTLEWSVNKLAEKPVGHFLNPAYPEKDELLKDKDVLVRASMPNSDAQKHILLRPATDEPETNPNTLLRAANAETIDFPGS